MTAHRPDPRPETATAVAARLGSDLAAWRRDGFGRWLALSADTPVGTAGLSPAPDHDALALSWHVAPAQWGQGLATEMAAALVDHATIALAALRLIALIRPVNLGSAGVAERLGFRPDRQVMLHGAPTNLWLRRVR